MALDKATVARIATLARIKVPEAEQGQLAQRAVADPHLDRAARTRSTPPASSRCRASPRCVLPMREDVVSDGNCRDRILANAPEAARRLLRRAQGGGIGDGAHRAHAGRGARRSRARSNSRRASWPRRISRRWRRRGRSMPFSPRRRSARSPWPAAADDAARARRRRSRSTACRSRSRTSSAPKA